MSLQEEVERRRARLMQGQRGVRQSAEGTNDWLDDITETVADATANLNRFIEANQGSRDEMLPVLRQLVDLSFRMITMRHDVEGGQPPRGPVDSDGGRGDDGNMDARITALEKDVAAIKTDVAVIRSNYATGKEVSEAKSSIILWVVGAIFIAQLLPMVRDWVKPAAPAVAPAITVPQAPATAQPPAK